MFEDVIKSDDGVSMGFPKGPEGGEEGKAPEGGLNLPPLPGEEKPGEEKKPEDGLNLPPLPGEEKPGEEKKPEELDYTAFITDLNKRANSNFQSVDDIMNVLSENSTLRESETNLKAQMASFKNPLAENEEIAKIYQFQKETGLSPQDYYLVADKDIKEMDSLEALVLNEVLTNPVCRGKEALVRKSLERKFDLNNEDLDEDQMELNKFDLDKAGQQAKTKLLELQGKITVPDFNGQTAQLTDQMKAEMQKNEESWKAYMPKILDTFTKFPMYESDEDFKKGGNPFVEVDIPEDVRSAYSDILTQYIQDNNMPFTEESVRNLQQLMYQDYIMNNYRSIANAYAMKKVEENNAMWKGRTGQDISKLKEQKNPKDQSQLTKIQEWNNAQDEKALKGMF